MLDFDTERVGPIVELALKEDIGSGDITTEYFVGINEYAKAVISVNEPCLIAGIPVIKMVFHKVDPSLEIKAFINDGNYCQPREIISVSGRAASILTAERTVLNFIQRLSGIATYTNEFVKRVEKYGTMILDTRKTTPTLRYLDKYAVRAGGGVNHRFGLFDAVLLKENHVVIAKRKGADYLKEKIMKIRSLSNLQIIIEVHHIDDIDWILSLRPDVALLDNLSLEEMRQAVSLIGRKVLTEASGNVSLENVEAVAATGVDRISVGKLTHSFRSIDISLEMV